MARYRIVPPRSRVVIDATSSLHPIHSETDGLRGWLELAVDHDGGLEVGGDRRAHLELPVDHLRGGNPLEERELHRRIDARRFPTITGDLDTMEPTGREGRYRVGGDVTFRGVTRRREGEVAMSVEEGDALRLRGSSVFDIREFGMEPPRILMLRVAPDVTVHVDVLAEREG